MTRDELKKVIYKIPFKTREECKEYLKENNIKNYRIKKEKNGTYHAFLLTGGMDTRAVIFKNSFSTYPYIKIARQLCYPPSVIEKLRTCESEEECTNVLTDARHGIYPKEEK